MDRKVYTCFCTAVIHKGHLNIISEARKLGEVTVGVLSDEAMIRYNRFPTCTFEERVAAARSIEGVANVVVQKDMMYDEVIAELRPDYVIHGDNWCNPEAPEFFIRQNVESCLAKYGGRIVDVPYTFDPEVKRIDDIMEVTTKPIILDGDTGGLAEHFVYNVRTLERIGVSAVIIEDKCGLKKNSLFGTEVSQTQDSIDNFCAKIAAGKDALRTKEFMVIARCESLILERGMDDALDRCRAYVAAGADGIMIHSRKKDPAEILEFCDRFRAADAATPIVVVPTSFNTVTESELAAHGVNICIYANQLTRAAFPAMQSVAQDLLKYHRALEVDSRLMPFKKIITLIDG